LLTQLSATTFLSTRGVLVVMFIVKYLHDVLYLYLHPRYSYLYSYVLVLATTLEKCNIIHGCTKKFDMFQ